MNTIKEYRGLEIHKEGTYEKYLRGRLGKMHVGILGLKPHIGLYQTVSYLTAMAEINAKYIFRLLAGNYQY